MGKFNLATLVMIFPPLTTYRPHLTGHLCNHVADSSWVATFHLTLWQRNVMIGLLHCTPGTGRTGPNKTPCLDRELLACAEELTGTKNLHTVPCLLAHGFIQNPADNGCSHPLSELLLVSSRTRVEAFT